jgi:sugar phosphate isomerase/epimerase
MKLSLMTLTLRPLLQSGEMRLQDVFTLARETGFEAVEFSMPDYCGHPAGRVRELLETHGLKASCVNRMYELASEDTAATSREIQDVKKMVDDAAQLGAPTVMVVPTRMFLTMRPNARPAALERIITAFREIVAYAAPKGIAVTFEDFPSLNVPFCSIREVRHLLQSVEGLKLTFDNGNFYPSGDDMLDAYDQLWPYVVNAHVKEWERSAARTDIECADGTHLIGGLHGKGLLDQRGFLHALSEKAYGGYVAFEYQGNLHPAQAVREGAAYLKSIRPGQPEKNGF